jgi:hypothetical protein
LGAASREKHDQRIDLKGIKYTSVDLVPPDMPPLVSFYPITAGGILIRSVAVGLIAYLLAGSAI